jgi:hypothetical protein
VGLEFEFEFEMLGNKERSDGSLVPNRKAAVRPFGVCGRFVRGTYSAHQDALALILNIETSNHA